MPPMPAPGPTPGRQRRRPAEHARGVVLRRRNNPAKGPVLGLDEPYPPCFTGKALAPQPCHDSAPALFRAANNVLR